MSNSFGDECDRLIQEIKNRHADRLGDCANTDQHDKICRAQGAARELKDLLDFIEALGTPVEQEVEST